jgi:hypothetical protein
LKEADEPLIVRLLGEGEVLDVVEGGTELFYNQESN